MANVQTNPGAWSAGSLYLATSSAWSDWVKSFRMMLGRWRGARSIAWALSAAGNKCSWPAGALFPI